MRNTVAATTHRPVSRAQRRRAAAPTPPSVALAEIAALILIAVLLVIGVLQSSGSVHAQTPSVRIRVESRQSLWTLAKEHPVDGLSTEQTAELIENQNGLHGERLASGASIRIPVQERGGDAVALAMR